MLKVVRVAGVSMSPTLQDGDFVLVIGSRLCSPPRIGAVVLVAHPLLGTMIKRIVGRDAQQRVMLSGDNRLSISSEALGPVPLSLVLGQVRWKVTRDGAITRL